MTTSSQISAKNGTASVKKHLFTLVGRVVNTSLNKTITVSVTSKFAHPVYRKIVFKSKKYLVHDPFNRAQISDRVVIANSRKFSARKSFYLLRILKSTQTSTSQSVDQKGSTDSLQVKLDESKSIAKNSSSFAQSDLQSQSNKEKKTES